MVSLVKSKENKHPENDTALFRDTCCVRLTMMMPAWLARRNALRMSLHVHVGWYAATGARLVMMAVQR